MPSTTLDLSDKGLFTQSSVFAVFVKEAGGDLDTPEQPQYIESDLSLYRPDNLPVPGNHVDVDGVTYYCSHFIRRTSRFRL